MTSWLKLHVDILDDPKLMRARRHGYEQLVLVPWLFAFAKRANDNGRLSVGGAAAEPEDLVHGIPDDISIEAMRTALASCLNIGVLVEDPDGVLRFANWHVRQGKPTESAEAWRVRKQRQRTRQKLAKKGTVTPRHEKQSRGTIRDMSHLSRLQTETETETGYGTELGTNLSGLSPSKSASGAPMAAVAEAPPPIPPTPEEIATRERLRAEARALVPEPGVVA